MKLPNPRNCILQISPASLYTDCSTEAWTIVITITSAHTENTASHSPVLFYGSRFTHWTSHFTLAQFYEVGIVISSLQSGYVIQSTRLPLRARFQTRRQTASPAFRKTDNAAGCRKGAKGPGISFCRLLKRLILNFPSFHISLGHISFSVLTLISRKAKYLVPENPKYLSHRNKQKNQISYFIGVTSSHL